MSLGRKINRRGEAGVIALGSMPSKSAYADVKRSLQDHTYGTDDTIRFMRNITPNIMQERRCDGRIALYPAGRPAPTEFSDFTPTEEEDGRQVTLLVLPLRRDTRHDS